MTDHRTLASHEASATTGAEPPPSPADDQAAADQTAADETTIDQARADAFAAEYPLRPIPAAGPVDTRSICETPSAAEFLDPLWKAVVAETRTRGNDIHLPISVAYAERLCAAYPGADRELVLVATLLHDTGWAHVDESRILSEGFTGDWRKAAIRYEHEHQGCLVARRVLPGLGYSEEFIGRVTEIIDGHDTRHVAYSLEDALMRDADRSWRFDRAGIALASSWFTMDPATYADRLATEIVPELITDAAVQMATADLARSNALLKTGVLR
ncbi:HD domain-containing protein [Sinomonas sp. P10A9]|uniref:HD domain-containing protein n=1 Tax=Sinomonas puerhi TaxID=3238584 RepID=A0AB39L507_9MICC